MKNNLLEIINKIFQQVQQKYQILPGFAGPIYHGLMVAVNKL